MSFGTPPEIRELNPGDSLSELTDLLHRAYTVLADQGLRYVACHQDVTVTRERIAKGVCLVALVEGRLVGTVVYHRPDHRGGTPFLDRDDVAHFGQFAVEPSHQSQGIGERLLASCLQLAADDGAAELALDTAEQADRLIDWYTRLGFRFVEYADWRPMTNYRSVVMSRTLAHNEAERR